jgi:hypothetical protein
MLQKTQSNDLQLLQHFISEQNKKIASIMSQNCPITPSPNVLMVHHTQSRQKYQLFETQKKMDKKRNEIKT